MFRRYATGVVFVIALLSSVLADELQSRLPFISAAIADLEHHRLTIEGMGFGQRPPIVTLGLTRLAILAASDTRVVVALPNGIRPGTYLLLLDRREQRDSDDDDRSRQRARFDVSIGG